MWVFFRSLLKHSHQLAIPRNSFAHPDSFKSYIQLRSDIADDRQPKIGFDIFNLFNTVNFANPTVDLQDTADFVGALFGILRYGAVAVMVNGAPRSELPLTSRAMGCNTMNSNG